MSAFKPQEALRDFRAAIHPHLPRPRSSSSLFPFPRRTKRVGPPTDFQPPTISARLRPLVPFFIYWSMITSLTVHQMRERISFDERSKRHSAQLSVLERLVERLGRGDTISEEERERELEMVGLRERNWTREGEGEGEMRQVGWREVFLGRKRKAGEQGQEELRAEEEWREVVTAATQTPAQAAASAAEKAKHSTTAPVQRPGSARRAKSADDYLG